MARLELRSHSGFCGEFGNCLQVYRSASQSRLNCYSIAMGERRAAADLLLGTALVSARARPDLSDRVCVALGTSGRADRQRWCVAPESIPAGGLRTTRRRGLRSPPNALLARLEQHLSPFPLRRRCCSFFAFDFRDRTGDFARRTFYLLPVAHHRWANVPEFSMGRSAARDRFPVDLFCAMATLAKGSRVAAGVNVPGYSGSCFACGFVFAHISSVYTYSDCRRGVAH